MEVRFVERHPKLDGLDKKVRCCCGCKKVLTPNSGVRFYDGEYFWHFDCYLRFVEEMKRIDKELCLYEELLETDLMDVG